MNDVSIWAVVPAAGIGKRMLSAIPKQYLPLSGATVLEVTLNRLLTVSQVSGLVIALQETDEYWNAINLKSHKPVLRARGGAERSDSVLNALQRLSENMDFNTDKDWVLVHDAVRPCVRRSDIEKLIEQTSDSESGGLLALPVRDTMKRQGNTASVSETVNREGLWHALTPQLFPFRLLRQALLEATEQGAVLTDESSAMEYAGYSPILVQGHEDNIKITRPDDLRLAEIYLTEAG